VNTQDIAKEADRRFPDQVTEDGLLLMDGACLRYCFMEGARWALLHAKSGHTDAEPANRSH
jgi:hypothetical protein